MKRNGAKTAGMIMIAIAVVFVIYALNHPEISFPWSNIITWILYAFYAIIAAVLIIYPSKKK